MTLFGDRQRARIARHKGAFQEDATFWGAPARRVEQGDREAEAELARQCYVRVRPMVSAHLHGSDAALDINQETVLAALEALRAGKIREPGQPPYTTPMSSVADDLRRALRERILAMTPEERVVLTARLAESDLDLFCSARTIPRDEGRRLLMRARQVGRRPSRVAQGPFS